MHASCALSTSWLAHSTCLEHRVIWFHKLRPHLGRHTPDHCPSAQQEALPPIHTLHLEPENFHSLFSFCTQPIPVAASCFSTTTLNDASFHHCLCLQPDDCLCDPSTQSPSHRPSPFTRKPSVTEEEPTSFTSSTHH